MEEKDFSALFSPALTSNLIDFCPSVHPSELLVSASPTVVPEPLNQWVNVLGPSPEGFPGQLE